MTKTSKNKLWEAVAYDWDARIGSDGNNFHRELVRPATVRLLAPQPGERILDIACGNGFFARYLAELGVQVVAFDYSHTMIEYAKMRCDLCFPPSIRVFKHRVTMLQKMARG